MTTAALLSKGATFSILPSGGGLVAVAELLTLNPAQFTRALLDVTTHDSSGATSDFITDGTYDPGEISGTVHYIANSTNDTAMNTAMTGGAKQDYSMVVKKAGGTATITGSGYLTKYGPDGLNVQGKQTASFTFKRTGAHTQT